MMIAEVKDVLAEIRTEKRKFDDVDAARMQGRLSYIRSDEGVRFAELTA